MQQVRTEDAEALRLRGAMLWAKGGEIVTQETDPELDLFAMEKVGLQLRQRYGEEKIRQQVLIYGGVWRLN